MTLQVTVLIDIVNPDDPDGPVDEAIAVKTAKEIVERSVHLGYDEGIYYEDPVEWNCWSVLDDVKRVSE